MEMLKKTILLIVLVLISLSDNTPLQAQAKSLSVGNKFYYRGGDYGFGTNSKVIREVVGDTIINGVSYAVIKQLEPNIRWFLERSDSAALYRYSAGVEEKIFDLNWKVGEFVRGGIVTRNGPFPVLDTTLQLLQIEDYDSYSADIFCQLVGFYNASGEFSFFGLDGAIIDQKLIGDTTLFINVLPDSSFIPDTVYSIVGQNFQRSLPWRDSELDILSYELLQGPENLSLVDDPVSFGTNLQGFFDQTGIHPIKLSVTDNRGKERIYDFLLNVYNPYAKPVVSAAPPKVAMIDSLYIHQFRTSKPALGEVGYVLRGAPDWISLTETGLISGTPLEDDVGNHSINMRLFNRINSSADLIYIYTLTVPEKSPKLRSEPVKVAQAGSRYTYQISALFPLAGELGFSLEEGPEWLSLSESGLLSGTPSTVDIGKHPVKIFVFNKDYRVENSVQAFFLHVAGDIESFTLFPNYPNPFNGYTTIKYFLPKPDRVEIRIFNVSGQLMRQIISLPGEEGFQTCQINSYRLTSGVYFYQVKTSTETKTGKLMLLK